VRVAFLVEIAPASPYSGGANCPNTEISKDTRLSREMELPSLAAWQQIGRQQIGRQPARFGCWCLAAMHELLELLRGKDNKSQPDPTTLAYLCTSSHLYGRQGWALKKLGKV